MNAYRYINKKQAKIQLQIVTNYFFLFLSC